MFALRVGICSFIQRPWWWWRDDRIKSSRGAVLSLEEEGYRPFFCRCGPLSRGKGRWAARSPGTSFLSFIESIFSVRLLRILLEDSGGSREQISGTQADSWRADSRALNRQQRARSFHRIRRTSFRWVLPPRLHWCLATASVVAARGIHRSERGGRTA